MSKPWTDGFGQDGGDHEQLITCFAGCPVHNPTDPHTDWPLFWRGDKGIFERVCPCGVGHPDQDSMRQYREQYGDEASTGVSIHGCCGACTVTGCPSEKEIAKDNKRIKTGGKQK